MTGELFVELRCEELPASMVRPALAGLAAGLEALLDGVPHGAIRTWATPRRLAVAIADVASGRPAVEREITGPPADRAFKDGVPTAVAEGFARSKGVDVADLRVVELPKRGAVLAVTVREGGEQVVDLVTHGLADVIAAVPFRKAMVWGEGGLTWGRPLHGIVATYAGAALSGQAHGIAFGTSTLGHRRSPGPVSVTGSADWLTGLRAHHVEPDLDVRARRIQELLAEAAAAHGGDPIDLPELAEEVLHLVEWPGAVVGSFDEDLLELPPRLLTTAMRVHQRYFPITRDGALTNRFVVITNNPFGDAEVIAEGNARVLRPRFYDARFFFADDRQHRLEHFAASLGKMRWIRGLGTMADKAARVAALAGELAPRVGADAAQATRAGALSKADLTSKMVGEFPELQGHMGRLYAAAQGEPQAVAVAIEEHYQPAFAADAVAASPVGVAVALADRLDTLVGAFGIGMEPTGGGDPQGLRRAALGLVRTLVEHGLRVDVAELVGVAVDAFHDAAGGEGFEAWHKARGTGPVATARDALVASLVAFVTTRHKAWWQAEGAPADYVDAVLDTVAEVGGYDPVRVHQQVSALVAASRSEAFGAVLEVFKRVLNILQQAPSDLGPAAALSEPVEAALHTAVAQVGARVDAAVGALDYAAALDAMVDLRAPVEDFFTGVMVHADDPAVRSARLGLLAEVARTLRGVADFSRISTR